MKKKIIALCMAALLILTLCACTTVPETPNPNESQNGLSAKEHYNDVMMYLSRSKYVFFHSYGDEDCYDVEIEKDNEKLEGKLEADFLENKYGFDFEIEYTADGENVKELDASVDYADGYLYTAANGISTLPLKTAFNCNGIESDALRALYGIRRLTYSAFMDDIEKYYRIIETEDKNSTVATLSITGEDIKKHAENNISDEAYGFDAESIKLNCNISLKTQADASLTDFKIDSALSFTTGEKSCEFNLNYTETSFDAVFRVSSESGNAEYSLKAENGKGTLILNGEPREMDTEGYMNAPEHFKCRTLEVPFEYSESSNPELNGYNIVIERVRFIGEAAELESNTATTAEDDEFVFGTDVDLQMSIVHFANTYGLRVGGYYNGASFEITSKGNKEINITVPAEYCEDENTFNSELYEKAPEFCERFGILQESADPEGIIEASDGFGSYIIDLAQKNGYYTTSFTMISEGIKFTDGRVLPLTYESLLHDDENDVRTATINGRNYLLSSYTDFEGTLCQSLECTDEIEGYATTSKVLFYPELEYGDITMGFTVEINGNEYTFTYLDGYTEKRIIAFDEEIGAYRFIEE